MGSLATVPLVSERELLLGEREGADSQRLAHFGCAQQLEKHPGHQGRVLQLKSAGTPGGGKGKAIAARRHSLAE